jgi:probable rRNA maturation factor
MYRNIDRSTNVLSLAYYSPTEIQKNSLENILLGDVILAYNAIEVEACLFNRSFEERVVHLFVHGVLHLLGYGHVIDKDRQKMEALEIEILGSIGIKNPYIVF